MHLKKYKLIINSIKKSVFIFLLGILLSSCMKDSLIHNFNKLHVRTKGHAVFIVNEGNFMYGNSSLTYYNPETGKVLNDVFYKSNALPLGDVADFMIIHDSLAYLVVNNSGKIYIINKNTFKYTGKITGFISPRQMAFISGRKAYVSDLYAESIQIVNPATNKITGFISTPHHSSEQILLYGSYAFINSWSYDNKILIIDTRTDCIVDSITVTKQPNSMVLDRNGTLWVLSDGGYPQSPYGQEMAALTKINPVNRKIEKVFLFKEMSVSPSHLRINPDKDSLFFIYNSWAGGKVNKPGIYSMNINSEKLPELPVIPQNARTFYSLGIDYGNGFVYVADALDFMQRGKVFVYSAAFAPVDSLKAGIIPGYFCFKK